MKFLHLILLIPIFCFSQNLEYEFIGTIELSNKTLLTYKLEFNETENGKIEGFSVTDFNGEHRTKSKISGFVDKKKDVISFKEESNISTLSTYNPSSFCYVNVDNAKVKLRNRKSIIQGAFKGKFQNNKDCAKGYVYLIGSEFFFNKMTKVSKKVEKMKKVTKEKKESLRPTTMRNELDKNLLKDKSTLTIQWKTDKLRLKVVDSQKEDGDRITIVLNDKVIRRNYEVTKREKFIDLDLKPGANILKVTAENLGKKPPNSANIGLIDGGEEHDLITRLEVGNTATVILNK